MILLLFTVHGLQSINEPRSTGDNELSWIVTIPHYRYAGTL